MPKLPQKVEKLLINTDNIDKLIEIVHSQEVLPELEGCENELDYLAQFDENQIYELWLEL